MLKVIELFSGIGSQRKALDNIGIKYKVIAFCDIDKFAEKSYRAIWHRVSEVQQFNSERGWFVIEKKHYFILRSLVIKYGKDNVINTVNNIVINNVKEDE
ncbi:DNA cytosine methyltransferase [Spiroplasma endosymbiont of Phyllotreta cruciferae]|uniref:DNA cytosine methyltransferase n=1 Tax=Spiroplasma endosymbiont of Phyllotreta cruciferae TaxID=2886375 RepID=UPI0035123ECD